MPPAAACSDALRRCPQPSDEGGLETLGLRGLRGIRTSLSAGVSWSLRDPDVAGTMAFLKAGLLSLLGVPICATRYLCGEDMGKRHLLWPWREVMKDLLPK